MNKKIFDTNNAPADEIEGVRRTLESAGIEFYEIGNNTLWGGGALCVRDPADFHRARELIQEFQISWVGQAHTRESNQGINWVLAIPILFILALFLLVTIGSIT